MPDQPVESVAFRHFGLLFIVVCILHVSLVLPQAQPQVALKAKNIMVLHVFEANMPINAMTDQGIRAAMESGGLGVKNQFFEFLDLARNPGSEHERHAKATTWKRNHLHSWPVGFWRLSRSCTSFGSLQVGKW